MYPPWRLASAGPTGDPAIDGFRVERIDHVELFVPARRDAARWYRAVLGLRVLEEYERWADDPRGPLMISSDGGDTKLALLRGEVQGERRTAGYHLVAFRVGAGAFRAFVDRLETPERTDHHSRRVDSTMIADHQQALSIYFNDPWGHRIEITTYEVEAARRSLAAVRVAL